MMETALVYAALGALLSACVCAVSILLLRRQKHVDEDAPDVLELAHELAALKKQVKRAYMSRVREGEGGSSLDSMEAKAPPELQTHEPAPASSQDLKQRLRDAAFSGGPNDWRKYGH